MQYIALDVHKRYTWARVEGPDGVLVREKKVVHRRGALREFLAGHDSERGSQYSSLRFGAGLRAARILPSMGRKGDAYDNALCEAFFATLNREVLGRCRFRTREEARSVLFACLEGFYNRRS
jgi:transposase InsO family protein